MSTNRQIFALPQQNIASVVRLILKDIKMNIELEFCFATRLLHDERSLVLLIRNRRYSWNSIRIYREVLHFHQEPRAEYCSRFIAAGMSLLS